MPGAFAHMIAANQAKTTLEDQGLVYPTKILNRHPQWMQAGAVGPDYPYLHHALTSHDPSDNWADLLHYVKTGDVVRAGVSILRQRYDVEKETKEYQRSAAWLFGYASHLVLDASVHPVVRAIVGEYEQNKTEHRTCEMYMDSFIHMEIYGYEMVNTEWADYLRALTDENTGGMNTAVASLWSEMLQQVYPDDFVANPPAIDGWQKAYVDSLDVADINLGFFRHIASEHGLAYVKSTDIPDDAMTKYIKAAALPTNNKFGQQTMHYRDIFNFGAENVARYWARINEAIEGGGDPLLPELPNWNLDKGTVDPEGLGDATLWV